ncbi:hypothetical protein HMPREF9520_03250 [Enterococcus faecalis TX1467]|nr:hypothetical protein HMPREF9520_03250 [Enterococcus faecalis TX1467]
MFIKGALNYIVQQRKILKKERSIEILSKSYKKALLFKRLQKSMESLGKQFTG